MATVDIQPQHLLAATPLLTEEIRNEGSKPDDENKEADSLDWDRMSRAAPHIGGRERIAK